MYREPRPVPTCRRRFRAQGSQQVEGQVQTLGLVRIDREPEVVVAGRARRRKQPRPRLLAHGPESMVRPGMSCRPRRRNLPDLQCPLRGLVGRAGVGDRRQGAGELSFVPVIWAPSRPAALSSMMRLTPSRAMAIVSWCRRSTLPRILSITAEWDARNVQEDESMTFARALGTGVAEARTAQQLGAVQPSAFAGETIRGRNGSITGATTQRRPKHA